MIQIAKNSDILSAVDSGCSALLADGTIKLKSGVEISQVNEHSVVLSDSSEREADAVVYA